MNRKQREAKRRNAQQHTKRLKVDTKTEELLEFFNDKTETIEPIQEPSKPKIKYLAIGLITLWLLFSWFMITK